MKNLLSLIILLVSAQCFAGNPTVLLKTTMGDIRVELDSTNAPITVKNFLGYVNSGFYNQTIVHRVVKNFVIQGGGLDQQMNEKPTSDPIKNEAGNGLSNLRGTIGMARTSDVDSATSQFFINIVDNKKLDHVDDTPAHFGYAVFGKVISGMDIIDSIQNVAVKSVGEYDNVPVTSIVLISAQIE